MCREPRGTPLSASILRAVQDSYVVHRRLKLERYQRQPGVQELLTTFADDGRHDECDRTYSDERRNYDYHAGRVDNRDRANEVPPVLV